MRSCWKERRRRGTWRREEPPALFPFEPCLFFWIQIQTTGRLPSAVPIPVGARSHWREIRSARRNEEGHGKIRPSSSSDHTWPSRQEAAILTGWMPFVSNLSFSSSDMASPVVTSWGKWQFRAREKVHRVGTPGALSFDILMDILSEWAQRGPDIRIATLALARLPRETSFRLPLSTCLQDMLPSCSRPVSSQWDNFSVYLPKAYQT